MGKRNSGREINIKLFYGILLFCLAVLAAAAPACAASYSLKLRQIYTDFPNAAAYFDLRDTDGNCAAVEENGKLSLNIGGREFKPLSVKRFSRKDEGVAAVFAVDVSSSISSKRFAELQDAIALWLKRMGPKDYAAIVSFGDSVNICQDYTQNPKTLVYTVRQLKAKDKNTQLNSGIVTALDLAGIVNSSLPQRRIVVLCSDGMDDSTLSATKNEACKAIDNTHIPVYSIFFEPGKTSKEKRKAAVDVIGEYSRRSGGNLYDAKKSSFQSVLDKISDLLNGSMTALFNIENALADGSVQRASLIYSNGSTNLSDGMDIRILNTKGTPDAISKDSSEGGLKEDGGNGLDKFMANKPLFFGSIALLVLLAVAFMLFSARSKKKREAELLAVAGTNGGNEPPTQVASVTERRTAIVGSTAPAPSGPAIEAELTVTGSSARCETYRTIVRDRVTIGRKGGDPSVLGIPGDATISARHCELIFSKGRLFVADLNSTNGTMVNGSPISGMYPLNNGDRILLGKTELKVKITWLR